MMKSCLAVLLFLAAIALLAAGGFFLWDTSQNAKFDRTPVDETRFAE